MSTDASSTPWDTLADYEKRVEAQGAPGARKSPKPLPLHKIHPRTICAARKGRTQKEVQDIINLEIEWFLRENPEYFFEKVQNPDPPKNNDHSRTFNLQFKRNL